MADCQIPHWREISFPVKATDSTAEVSGRPPQRVYDALNEAAIRAGVIDIEPY
mgnify:CR=1 FL=1